MAALLVSAGTDDFFAALLGIISGTDSVTFDVNPDCTNIFLAFADPVGLILNLNGLIR